MPSLFGGVENFVPAFQGRQLAIQSGQGAGQSIARGTAAMQRGQAQELDDQKFKFTTENYPKEFALRQRSEQVREDELKFRQEQWEAMRQMNKLNSLKNFLDDGMPP